jgi:hypothetical protein
MKEGGVNRVLGMDARVGVAGIIGRKRPQFLRLHYADGGVIKHARLMRGGKVDVVRRMKTNAKELAKVFTAMGRPKAAAALKSLAKKSPQSGSPYLGTGVYFGGIWKDPGVGVTLPSGDRLYFRMESAGKYRMQGHEKMKLSYGLARVGGATDSHKVTLHSTTGTVRQQQNNARKVVQALDFLESNLVAATQP